MCSLLSAGAITVIGDIRPSALETVIDYAQDTQIPFIFLNNPTDSREWSESKKSMQVLIIYNMYRRMFKRYFCTLETAVFFVISHIILSVFNFYVNTNITHTMAAYF